MCISDKGPMFICIYILYWFGQNERFISNTKSNVLLLYISSGIWVMWRWRRLNPKLNGIFPATGGSRLRQVPQTSKHSPLTEPERPSMCVTSECTNWLRVLWLIYIHDHKCLINIPVHDLWHSAIQIPCLSYMFH
jgi:hypothetical protein